MFIDMKARCFMEAAKCLNFTRAAEKLYISQPALSKNIAALEEECGMKLFYRDTRHSKVKLTPAGAVMLCEFQKMEHILEGVVEKARLAESGQEGHLTIGLLSGQIINDITTEVICRIDSEYPKIQIDKIQGGFRELRNWLEDGTVDMAVTFEAEAVLVKDVLYEEVEEVQLGIAVPAHHRLARKRNLKIRDLEKETIILPDERETYCIPELFRARCRGEGFIPREITAPDLGHINMMAEMGKGIIITREDSIETRSPNLKFFRSSELGTVKLVAAWRRDNLNPIITFYHRMYEDIYHQVKASRAGKRDEESVPGAAAGV
ncbi:MAG: LysR substrate-binding domain-containing protein [Emergencia sp.]